MTEEVGTVCHVYRASMSYPFTPDEEVTSAYCSLLQPGKTFRMIHKLVMEIGKKKNFNEKAARAE